MWVEFSIRLLVLSVGRARCRWSSVGKVGGDVYRRTVVGGSSRFMAWAQARS